MMEKRKTEGVYRRGSTWWFRWWIGGREFRESSGSETKSVAIEKRALKIAAKVECDPSARTSGKVRMHQLFNLVERNYELNDFSSIGDLKSRIRTRLRDYFGGMKASQVTMDLLERYIQDHRAGLSDASINRDLAIISSGFTLAKERGMIAHTPVVPWLKEKNVRRVSINEAELQTLLTHLPDDAGALVQFLFLTGWRLSEGLTLKRSQVDFDRQFVYLEAYSTKNKDSEPRVFPFTSQLRELLEDQVSKISHLEKELHQHIGLMFVRFTGRFAGRALFNGKRPGATKYFKTCWLRACEASGLSGRIRHDLRRGAAVVRDQAGISAHDNQLLGGWKTHTMLERYLQKRTEDLRLATAKLDATRTISAQSDTQGRKVRSVK